MRDALNSCLVDSNVLLYGYDTNAPEKRDQAISILDALGASRNGVVTVQILNEFFWNATTKLKPAVIRAVAEARVRHYIETWLVLDMTSHEVLEAMQLGRRYELAHWDSLILATAKLHGVPTLLTEDLQNGQVIEGVRIINPFSSAFDLASLSVT